MCSVDPGGRESQPSAADKAMNAVDTNKDQRVDFGEAYSYWSCHTKAASDTAFNNVPYPAFTQDALQFLAAAEVSIETPDSLARGEMNHYNHSRSLRYVPGAGITQTTEAEEDANRARIRYDNKHPVEKYGRNMKNLGKAGALAVAFTLAPEISYWAYSGYYVGTSDHPEEALTEVLQGGAAGLAGRMLGRAVMSPTVIPGSPLKATVSQYTEAHALAPLRAEVTGGQRVWLVGPTGAQSTVGVRYHSDGFVTFDTTVRSGPAAASRYSKAIENHLGLRGPVPKHWWSGNHGSPSGAWTREERFLHQDRGALERRRAGGWSVHDSSTLGLGRDGAEPPACTVLSWCYSSRNLHP
jgi:hypothetical protein